MSTKVTLQVQQVETLANSWMNTSSGPFRFKGFGGFFCASNMPMTAFGSEDDPVAWDSQHARDQVCECARKAHATCAFTQYRVNDQ